MFFYITDTLLDFIPLLFIFFVFSFFFGGKRRPTPPPENPRPGEPGEYQPQEYEPGEYQPEKDMEEFQDHQSRDLAAEFERLLHKKKREQVYSEPQAEPQKVAQPVKFTPQKQQAVAPPTVVASLPRKRAAHPRLVQGLIMAEVLGKPRSLRPYGEERQ